MIPQAAQVRVFGIVPAAGSSRRMGRPKSTLPYCDSTMVGTVARTLLEADLCGVVIVTRSESAPSLDVPDDPRIVIAFNDDARSEMIDSVRVGLSHMAGLGSSQASSSPLCIGALPVGNRQSTISDRIPLLNDLGVLVVPADMPTIRVETHRACIAVFAGEPQSIVIAANRGKRGHPLIFPWSLAEDVLRLRNGLRELAQLHLERVRLVETEDPGVKRDVNSPADYEQLRSTERGVRRPAS